MTNDDKVTQIVKMVGMGVGLGGALLLLVYLLINVSLHPSYMKGKRAMEAMYVGDDTFVDSDGEAWEYNGTGYKLNEEVVLVFDTQDTDTIYDDEIVDIQY